MNLNIQKKKKIKSAPQSYNKELWSGIMLSAQFEENLQNQGLHPAAEAGPCKGVLT